MRRIAAWVALTVFSLLLGATAGQPAPVLDGRTLQGTPFSLQAQRGRVVVVDFWASYCEPCRRTFPALSDLARRRASEGLTVVGVSVDDEASNAQRAVQQLRPSFAIVHDADRRIVERWQPPAMPSTFVIGRDGRVLAIVSGENIAQLSARIDAALRR
ncbi:MAG: TlpA disulfide reductase family protein [Polyangiales bacterium]